MDSRGYTLLDFSVWGLMRRDENLTIRVMEYMRQHFWEILPEIPVGCEVDLLAAGTAHNIQLIPAFGLYAPPHLLHLVPDPFLLIDRLQQWWNQLSDEQLRAIGLTTAAPTWA